MVTRVSKVSQLIPAPKSLPLGSQPLQGVFHVSSHLRETVAAVRVLRKPVAVSECAWWKTITVKWLRMVHG